MKKTIFSTIIAASLMVGCSAPEQSASNPLLEEWTTPFAIPPFSTINASHFMPAYKEAFAAHAAEIKAIVENSAEPTFENTIAAYDKSGRLLSKVGSVFSAMNSGLSSEELRSIAKELSPISSAHYDDIRLNPELFKRIKSVYDKRESLNLNTEQTKLLTEMFDGFANGGANLSPADQQKLRELNTKISALQLAFGQNLLSETADFKMFVNNKADLAGLTEDFKTMAADRATAAGQEGNWLFGLDNPSIMPFLQYSENAALREKMLNGYLNRANYDNENDNKEVIKQLITLRLERAKLMGHATAADYILKDRCAKTAENVYALLDQLWAPTMKVAATELNDIKKMAKAEGQTKVGASDWRYYAAKAKADKFDLSDEEVMPYFQRENVRMGMFYVATKLFGITFTKLNDVPTLVAEQEVFEVKDADGSHLGVLFDDTYARPGLKNGGAWCSGYRSQGVDENGKRIAPLVTITCNFTAPIGDKPSLLTADEASTYFHEFGHALASLLRQVNYYGTGGYPRDFVELPSQIMEHWVFEPEVLKVYAKHYKTGEVIPDALVKKIIESGKYGQGFATGEYLAASFLDMDYHTLTSVDANFNVAEFETKMLNDKRKLLTEIPPRYRSTYFSHTMGGGYTAGYYSYIWAAVLDSDAYAAFKESGDIFNPEIAKKYREEILEKAGSEEAMVLYNNFRGSEPDVKWLLNDRGLN
ncbi:MAG: M3 family metallopeptidase [Rikenellaceae bacterium]